MKMRTLKVIPFIILTGCFLPFSVVKVAAQEYLTQEKSVLEVDIASASLSQVYAPPYPNTCVVPRQRIASAQFLLEFSARKDGIFDIGEGSGNEVFDYSVGLRLHAYDKNDQELTGIFLNPDFILTINNNQPESVFSKDLRDFIQPDPVDEYTDIISVARIDVEITNPVTPAAELQEYIHLSAVYQIKYGNHVYGTTTPLPPPDELNVKLTSSARTLQFTWDHPLPFSGYQLQLVKLFNINPDNYNQGGTVISANLDWSKALTLEIPVDYNCGESSGEKSVNLSINGGTGYYAWRVRAIGGYYKDGVSNNRNLGRWSNNPNVTELSDLNLHGAAFYFEDQDDSDPDFPKNAIHSRVFTEENKTKEVSTYADGLQNVKQTKTYLPSSDVTIIAQTEQDYSGRNALATMPIPVSGKAERYNTRFLRSADGGLYTAEDFDSPESEGIPSAVSETREMGYYNDNADSRIPEADGYPFTRTLYYDDGTGRVKEQSAPGSTFALKEDGTGKTIRYFYGAASEAELVKIFGKEAPNHEQVIKSITVDPNNVATVSYTTSEGNVIATGLTFFENGPEALENLESYSTETITISEKATNNVKSGTGFYSSKRFILTGATNVAENTTPVTFEYRVNLANIPMDCADLPVDCKYDLEMWLTDLETGIKEKLFPNDIDGDTPLSQMNAVTIEGEKYKIVSKTRDLEPGTYVVEKKIIPGEPKIMLDEYETTLQKQIKPITNLIIEWLEFIDCSSDPDEYYKSLNALRKHLQERTLNLLTVAELGEGYTLNEEFSDFVEDDYDDLKDKYVFEYLRYDENGKIQIVPDSEEPNAHSSPEFAVISTSGCCDILFPVKWIPHFNLNDDWRLVDYDDNGLEVMNYNDVFEQDLNPEFVPDFEGYAMAFFEGCLRWNEEEQRELTDEEYKTVWDQFREDYMWGYREGDFNLMVYHMLTDEYKGTNDRITSETEDDYEDPPVDQCGNELDISCETEECTHYNAYDLFECWKTVLSKLQEEIDCGPAMEYGLDDMGETNISDAVDDEADDEERGETHDKHLDDNAVGDGWLIKWIAKRKLSRRVREDNANGNVNDISNQRLYTTHLVKDFLECTGYEFAKIITPYDPYPLDDDRAPANVFPYHQTELSYRADEYHIFITGDFDQASSYISYDGNNYPTYKKEDQLDYYYVPLKYWDPKTKRLEQIDGVDHIVTSDTSLFPFIRNPIFAFKYFEYPYHGVRRFAKFEQMTSFEDPNDCYQTTPEGRIVWDEATQTILRKPCCVSATDETDHTFCLQDYRYPYIEEIDPGPGGAQENDPRYGLMQDPENPTEMIPYKYVVRKFASRGRVRCPYDHTEWSNGQRYTFYNSLISFTPPSIYGYNPEDELSTITRDCNFYTQSTQWVHNPYQLGGYPEYLSTSEYAALSGEIPGLTVKEDWSELGLPSSHTAIERDLAIIRTNCEVRCSNRRHEFTSKLYKLLNENCYIVGGCRVNFDSDVEQDLINNGYSAQDILEYKWDNDRTIPEEAVDAMVTTMIDQCKSQCQVNTYSCYIEGQSRFLYTPKTEPGPDNSGGEVTVLNYGLAGLPAELSSPYSNYAATESNPANITGTIGTEITGYLIAPESQPLEENYSWYQYTKIKQATEWDFDLAIESKCDMYTDPGEKEFTADGDDTYIPRNEYEIEKGIDDMNNTSVNDAVNSPAIDIDINQ